MSLLINVNDDLARRLQEEARVRSVSVEELALAILNDAIPGASEDENWGSRNQRRLELIRKSTRSALSEPEQAELDQLQSWLDEQFEPFDAGLLRQLDEVKQAVARLSSGVTDE